MKNVFDMNEEEFIDYVANDCIAHMSEEDKRCFRENTDPISYHFGYGTYIRNNYIYDQRLSFFPLMADDLSNNIIKRIIEIISSGE